MHLIITDAWLAKSRAIYLSGTKLVVAVLALSFTLMVVAAGLYHWVFLKGAREGWPVIGTLVRLVIKDEFAQRDRFMRDNLDAMAKRLGENVPLSIVDKRRDKPGSSEVMNIIGDVSGRHCILIDDIVDSGGTLVNAAEALLEQGAREVYAYITHGVLSGGAVARIANSKLKELVITDSIMPTEAVKVARNIRVLSIAQLMGEAIERTAQETSVSSLFD